MDNEINSEMKQSTLFSNINLREIQEHNSSDIASETLSKLNISIDSLPRKCQQMLEQAAYIQQTIDIKQLDTVAAALQHSIQQSKEMEDDYEILKLKHKNVKLQAKIDRNNKFLDKLREDLQNSKESLAAENPNPENIHDYIRQTQQKVASYEKSCEKAKMKFTKLAVPEHLYPKALAAQITALTLLKEEAGGLQHKADDIQFANEARMTLRKMSVRHKEV